MNTHFHAAMRRAQRTAAARMLQPAAQGVLLDWQAIDSAPTWLVEATTFEARQRLCARTGAWWLAAALHACIDGRRLERVCALLGQELLTEIRIFVRQQGSYYDGEAESAHPHRRAKQEVWHFPTPSLPGAKAMDTYVLAYGQALLVWSLPVVLRAPVLACMDWTVDEEAYYPSFMRHRAWAQRALSLALAVPSESTNEVDP